MGYSFMGCQLLDKCFQLLRSRSHVMCISYVRF
uniref:Uncharacterized protein n=1 Tax=Arundo donax TaxID=35708 RepID=A0A0A9FEI1_ARUDO